jgi:DNA polymerase III sliding clamp (beta) subunit (PCNA family)
VIPKDNPYKVQISRESLKMALRRVQLSSDGTTNLAIMRSDGQSFIVEANNDVEGRQGSERVAVQETDAFLPQGFKIGMKLSNVIELLDMLDEDSVCLYFSDPSRPILLRNESQKLQGKTLLVMPMLIN